MTFFSSDVIGPAFAPATLATFAMFCPPQNDVYAVATMLSSKHTPGRGSPDEDCDRKVIR
jgi:hypothetical protein